MLFYIVFVETEDVFYFFLSLFMCGIAGSINFSLSVTVLSDLLRHRGPDSQDIWRDNLVTFFNSRLAIQGHGSDGAQPYILENLILVFNGEIYNHLDLRRQYGLVCSGNSDSETLLKLYQQRGRQMLNDLDGMFAFCIYDRTSGSIWFARDRCGEKPLYYYHQGDRFVFASELKTISTILSLEIDDQMVADFLAIGYLVSEQTPFKSVKQLPAGYELLVDISTMTLKLNQWWSLFSIFQKPVFKLDFEEALSETQRLIESSVKRCVNSSEKEVGLFLSGGIDSGLLAYYASKQVKSLKTFTIAFDGLYDEGPQAHQISKYLATDHREIRIGLENIANDLEKIFQSYGEPIVDDSIIPSHYVAREASNYLNVVLSGDGGDELFGGYRRYVPFSKIDFLSDRFHSFFNFLHRSLPFPRNKMSNYNYAYRLFGMLAKEWNEVYFAATIDLLHDYSNQFIVQPDYVGHSRLILPVVDAPWDGLRKIIYLDGVTLLPQILLKKMDIATMSYGLESRSPFLSNELLSFTASMPSRWKVSRGKTKYLLREIARRNLPTGVSSRPKRGFEIPLQNWVDTRLKDMIHDYLSAPDAYVRQIVCSDLIDQLLVKGTKFNPEKRAKSLFALLSVEVWRKSLNK